MGPGDASGEPLSANVEAAHDRDMREVASRFGVPPAAHPPTIAELREYFDAKVASLSVTDVGRDLGGFIVRPTLPARLDIPRQPALALEQLLTVGSPPPLLRSQFGLSWSTQDQRRFD